MDTYNVLTQGVLIRKFLEVNLDNYMRDLVAQLNHHRISYDECSLNSLNSSCLNSNFCLWSCVLSLEMWLALSENIFHNCRKEKIENLSLPSVNIGVVM